MNDRKKPALKTVPPSGTNGTNGHASVPQPSPTAQKAATRTLTEKQRQQLGAVNAEVTRSFANIGNLELQRQEIARQITEAAEEARKLIERRSTQLHHAAMAIDIDIISEDWSYDWERGVFHRGRIPGTMPIEVRRPQQPPMMPPPPMAAAPVPNEDETTQE